MTRAEVAVDQPAADSFAGGRFVGAGLRLDSAALAQALQLPVSDARREIQSLLCRALDVELAALIAHPESALEGAAAERYSEMLARRLAQLPLALHSWCPRVLWPCLRGHARCAHLAAGD